MLVDPTTPLTLAETLGAVLSAVVDAQQQAARATVDFINDVAFGPEGPAPEKPMQTATFRFSKLDEERLEAPFELEVPLLALVDIPLIAVRRATVSFSYDVTDAAPAEATSDVDGNGGTSNTKASLFNAGGAALLKGRFVKRSPSTSASTTPQLERSASIDVVVELEKMPPPVGLDRLLDILESGMSERRMEENGE